MPIYCTEKKTATIFFQRENGTKGQLIVSPAPVEIVCLQSNNQGKYIFTLAASGSNPDCSGDNGYQFGGDRIADSYQLGRLIPNYTSFGCSVQEIIFYPSGQTDVVHPVQYRISQRNNPDYNPSEGIQVKDGIGKVVFKEFGIKCNWVVSCDDDCPEGSHKCTHNKYPGYCCVPCKETGDRLKNIANKVGR
ncbi:hypothetical protein [Nostoc sp.]|uniref:hypothetical protein n=1 Tax=Nostoc sp. TaxID=1180 RepID=UPI002FFB5EC3